MAKDFVNVYETNASNASIAADASEFFFSNEVDRQNTTKWQQSFNFLEIVNDSSINIEIYLDGLSTRKRVLFGKASIIIKPEENIFFNNVKLTNTSSTTAITAADITLNAAIMKPEVLVKNARI